MGEQLNISDAVPSSREPRNEDIERRTQVHRRVAEAFEIAAEAVEQVRESGKRLAGECVLYSGGNDSTILAHLFRNDMDFAVHINTGIGIEDTRRFVRSTCAGWDLPLIEEHGESYRDLVIAHGFPGPAHHFKMYQRLKERGLRKVRKRLVRHPYRERVIFLAGRRRAESQRRANVPTIERTGSIVWASPLVNWTDEDMRTYREMNPDVPRNPVSEHLHMSGECLCGAFAKPGELEEIRFFYPEVAAEIEALQAEVAAAGNAPQRCVWGWGADPATRERERTPKAGWREMRYCRTCGPDALTDVDDHVENLGSIDHPYMEAVERYWWEPPRESGPSPLCSSCTLFSAEEMAALAVPLPSREKRGVVT